MQQPKGKYFHRFSVKLNEKVLNKTIQRCKEKKILIPTFAQMKNPELIPDKVKQKLPSIGLWDVNPLNLFRINWHNDIKTGLFGKVNYIEFPQSLTGVKARIFGLIGKYFPTGAHKVGAAFGCLVPRLVSGEFDPTTQKAVWPSTGNYCRGGAYDCALLDTPAIAILPEEMSKERFEWLKQIGTSEIFATPGCESNVKEIYDKCWELKKERGNNIVIFNQFAEFGNAIWHYHVTGSAVEEVFKGLNNSKLRLSAWVSSTGSAGTIAAGDYLKTIAPHCKIVAAEALQCPTLLRCGFGAHRIEGIGDKHIPWIHNVRNTNLVTAIDDESCIRLFRLFNEEVGIKTLIKSGVPEHICNNLNLLGISSISNLLAAIKTAKYFEYNEYDCIFMPLTDSSDMYKSRITEIREKYGIYTETQAIVDFERYLLGENIQNTVELTYYDQKRIHNLKYFTWVEQQGKSVEELNELWDPEFWNEVFSNEFLNYLDSLIENFNSQTKVLELL